MRYIFTFLLSLGLSTAIYAQQGYVIITGKVFYEDSRLPMQGASVFAQNTTIGTATDAEGNFKLYLPPGGYDIAVTFTGFETETKRVSSTDKLSGFDFYLKPKEKDMTEVAIIATGEVKDGWAKYGNFFIDNFIGQTENSKNCVLVNPEVVKVYFNKRRNRLKVMADEPLLIENRALGYKLKYALDSFTYQYNTDISLFIGSPLFENMVPENPEQEQKWMHAREVAYHGSMLHFMRSVYDETLEDEGFEIQFIISGKERDKALKIKDYYQALHFSRDDSTQTAEIKPSQPNVGVLYTNELPAAAFTRSHPGEPENFQFSILGFQPGETLVIEQNGYFYDQNDLTISAYWTWQKIADLLPYDYEFLAPVENVVPTVEPAEGN
ncbi:MAG: carboxypeptidase-like regulatory domain-containing protein [Ferruginibacter sp.]